MRKDKVLKAVKSPTTRKIHSSSKFSQVWYINSVRTGKPYQVQLTWSKVNGVKTLTGELISFDPNEQPHPANQSHTVCYQVLAAAKKMAREAGKTLSLCKSKEAAQNLLRLGGELIVIRNQSNGIVWTIIRQRRIKSGRM